MTKQRRIILACVIIGGIIVAYWLISPLFITRRVAEELPTMPANVTGPAVSVPATANSTEAAPPPVVPLSPQAPKELARGTFEGLAGHNAQGTARIIEADGKRYVRFESDFRITNGPDLFVYLGRNGAYDPNTRLSALKGNEGSQNYELPTRTDVAVHDEVWVWCRAFSVPFGKAQLVRSSP